MAIEIDCYANRTEKMSPEEDAGIEEISWRYMEEYKEKMRGLEIK